MKSINILPKQFSDSWLKEFRKALTNPNFITTPTTNPLGVRSDYSKDYGRDYFHGSRIIEGRPLTDKEWSNLQIARALLENR